MVLGEIWPLGSTFTSVRDRYPKGGDGFGSVHESPALLGTPDCGGKRMGEAKRNRSATAPLARILRLRRTLWFVPCRILDQGIKIRFHVGKGNEVIVMIFVDNDFVSGVLTVADGGAFGARRNQESVRRQ
jgi:hypothetical protein